MDGIHVCNIRCDPPIHAEIIYGLPGKPPPSPGPWHYLHGVGPTELISVEPAPEAPPPDRLGYTQVLLSIVKEVES